jgi:hypothetical protein
LVHSVMATEIGFSHTTIRRIWNAFGMQPHRSQTFKLSSDPLFVDKVRDIVGLYLSPPNRALALSVDEKTSYKRLIASSAVRSGAANAFLYPPGHNVVVRGPRYRFTPCDRQMLQTPSSDGVSRLAEANRRAGSQRARHPYHYGASWINQVERWLVEPSRKRIRRAPSSKRHNENPKPCRWTKSAAEILASVKRFCQKTEQTLCGEL